jgi:hypothetical protein
VLVKVIQVIEREQYQDELVKKKLALEDAEFDEATASSQLKNFRNRFMEELKTHIAKRFDDVTTNSQTIGDTIKGAQNFIDELDIVLVRSFQHSFSCSPKTLFFLQPQGRRRTVLSFSVTFCPPSLRFFFAHLVLFFSPHSSYDIFSFFVKEVS